MEAEAGGGGAEGGRGGEGLDGETGRALKPEHWGPHETRAWLSDVEVEVMDARAKMGELTPGCDEGPRQGAGERWCVVWRYGRSAGICSNLWAILACGLLAILAAAVLLLCCKGSARYEWRGATNIDLTSGHWEVARVAEVTQRGLGTSEGSYGSEGGGSEGASQADRPQGGGSSLDVLRKSRRLAGCGGDDRRHETQDGECEMLPSSVEEAERGLGRGEALGGNTATT